MTPTSGHPLKAHLRILARAVALGLGVALVLLAVRWHRGAREAGKPRANLARRIGQQYGLRVAPGDVILAGGAPQRAVGALRYRHVFFLGRTSAGAPRDVYWVLARVTPAGVPLGLRTLVNLSRTAAVDEDTVITSGPFVAFPIRVQSGVGAVAVVDLRGDHPSVLARKAGIRRLTNRITNFQESGHWRGFARHSLEPRDAAQQVTITWRRPGELQVVAKGPGGAQTAVLDCQAARLVSGHRHFEYQPPMKGDKPLFNWLVDTVRRLPFVGPKKIEWLQVMVYSVVDFFRRKVRGSPVRNMAPSDTGDAVTAVAVNHEPYQPRPGSVRASQWPPPPLKAILDNPDPKEGRWTAPPSSLIPYNPQAPPPVLTTYVHPDPKRRYAGVGVLIWDPRQVSLGMVAGTREPVSSTGLRGWGLIPRDDKLERVFAAFNGGFQTMHGEWGMQARGRLIREPAQWAATVLTDRSGSLAFGTWEDRSRRVPADVYSLRQNLAPMLENGVVNPLRNLYWGLAVRSQREKIYIIRSGLCLTKEGYGAYLWGKSVSLATLAQAMKMARCQYGMQMDINRTNASLELYRIARRATVKGPVPRTFARGGTRSFGRVPHTKDWVFRARSWLPGMYTSPFPRFIRRDWRDFMYLALRPILPGPNLSPAVSPARPGEGRWSVGGLPQGPAPFPPRIATTFLRPDPHHPDASVQIVKLDPRRLAYTAVSPAAGQGLPRSRHPIAMLLFDQGLPPALQVGRRRLTASNGRPPALLVERYRESESAPLARIGPLGSTPRDRRLLLAIAGRPLVAAEAGAATSNGGSGALRASAIGVDGDGYLCYAVTNADAQAVTRLTKALDLARCRKRLRLPDRRGGGPLVLGPVKGRVRLLPGDRAVPASRGTVVVVTAASHVFGRRIASVAHRPDQVLFGISRKEQMRLYRQKMRLKGKTP